MSSNEDFLSLWEAAVNQYIDLTNRSEAEQSALKSLETFEQLEEKLKIEHGKFEGFRRRSSALTAKLKYVSQPFNAFANVLSSAVALSPFAPAATLLGAVSHLFAAADGVSARYDCINLLLDKLENDAPRLKEYCDGEMPMALAAKAVQILGCFLEILALGEETIRTGRFKAYVANVFRDDDRFRDLLNKLTELVNCEQRLLVACNYTMTRQLDTRAQDIQHSSKSTLQYQQERQKNEVMNWLSRTDLSDLQDDIFHSRAPDTVSWAVESNEMKFWMNEPGQTLLCVGDRGAGKNSHCSHCHPPSFKSAD